ncbi:30S ribosomal protein S1 [Geobacter sp. SVR]|uniref:30S ribosomal protein S1 n=1 Tax=Geobacter sp. SVR TaxID=2495594 RepID=UPI00143EFEA7|nr:30S ribosomal protein S1 [Geobacter sp. SVR]BCS54464.1 30S ribosomal protein S1 [Geobacter sp. SVR]GCF87063.1 30S ribosomal protein S1 [Geobacter sp. SVR]
MVDFKRLNTADNGEHEDPDFEQQSDEFAALYSESLKERPERDKIIEGTVVRIDQETVLVDIGLKSEGHVPVSEFRDANGEVNVTIGDRIRVLMTREDGKKGYILSKKKADYQAAWEKIGDAGQEGGILEGTITARVNGGFSVDIFGVQAFLPASQVDIRPSANPENYIGLTGKFKVIKLNQRRDNIVLSRRAILEEERSSVRELTLEKLEEGQIVEGVVKNVTEYGAFVDLGGVDGLLHVSDLSWGRVGKPADVLKPGQAITAKVLKFDRTKGKISLGVKQTLSDPWLTVPEKYPVESRIKGRVVSLMEYGAFVELEPGVEGLIHVSEMSWTKRVRRASDILNVGDEVEAVVLGLDMGNRKISLGLKQANENPWTAIAEKYVPGTKIEGQIKNMTDFGMFIGIEDGIDGLVHVSDISWTKRIKHPGDVYAKGDLVHAVVLKVDVENERLSLGIKQLEPDPWSLAPSTYRPGNKVSGKVTSLTDFGVFVELEEGIEGLIHVSELSREKVPSAKTFAEIGDVLEAVVLSCDPKERRISLSIKALQAAAEKAEFEQYLGSQGKATSSFGELLQQELNNKNNN